MNNIVTHRDIALRVLPSEFRVRSGAGIVPGSEGAHGDLYLMTDRSARMPMS